MLRWLVVGLLPGCLIVVTDPDKDAVPDDTDAVDTERPDSVDDTVDSPDTDMVDTDAVDTDPLDTDPLDTDPLDSVETDTVDSVDTPASGAWSHTITVDGNPGDWLADERFATGSGAASDLWVTWDALYVYVAYRHPDVAAGTARHWLVLTLGNGQSGADAGVTLGTQEPGLAFDATAIVRWKADDSFNSLLVWNGAAWDNTDNWLGTQASQKVASDAQQTIELRLPRTVLGLQDELLVHANFVFEGAGAETSYGASPASSFPEGSYDPDYGAWYAFDLTGAAAPGASSPQEPVDTDGVDTPVDTVDTVDTPVDTVDTPVDTVDTPVDTVDTPIDTVDTPVDTVDTPAVPPGHAYAVDGAPDEWLPAERYRTRSGDDLAISWDAEALYLGLTHPEVATGGSLHWLVVTLGGEGASTVDGPALGAQQPGLPFGGTRVIRWKLDNSYDDLLSWDGSSWAVDAGWRLTTGGAVAERNDRSTVELRLPRAALGLGDLVSLHVNLVYEGAGYESSYSAAPAGSFADGAFDPDYTRYFSLDLRQTPGAAGVSPTDVDTAVDTDVVVDTPADTVDAPADTVDTPVDTVDTPADTVDTPADTVDTLADTVDTPADTVDTPADTVDTPVDTDLLGQDTADTGDTAWDTSAPLDTTPVDTTPVDTTDTLVDTTPADTSMLDTADTLVDTTDTFVDTTDTFVDTTDTTDTTDTLVDTTDTLVDTTDTTDTLVDTTDTTDTLVDTTDTPVDTAVPPTPWSYALSVDGFATDWTSDIRFASGASDVAVTWTATDLYVGVHDGNIGTGGPLHWVVITLGAGGGGSSLGAHLNTQEPLLPFPATAIVRWKCDDSYHDLQRWSGSSWATESYWLGTQGSALAERNDQQTFEVRLPRAELGLTTEVDVLVYFVYEGAGFESTFGAFPAGTIPEGAYDPDPASWYRFDLASPAPPALNGLLGP